MTRGRSALGAHAGLRWPLGPLLELARMSPSGFCHTYGVSGATMRRAIDGGLTDRQADCWANRIGLHPAEVWGLDWLTAGQLGTEPDDVRPARRPAPTRPGRRSKRSTGHTAARTPVPVGLVDEAMAS